MLLATTSGSMRALFAESSVTATGTGAAKALKAMERVSRAMRVFLNMMKGIMEEV